MLVYIFLPVHVISTMAFGNETHTVSEFILDLDCPCFATLDIQTPQPSWTPAQHEVSDCHY